MLTSLIQAKLSAHARAGIAVVGVAFVTALFASPSVRTWLGTHGFVRDLCGAVGAGYAAYVTYARPNNQL